MGPPDDVTTPSYPAPGSYPPAYPAAAAAAPPLPPPHGAYPPLPATSPSPGYPTPASDGSAPGYPYGPGPQDHGPLHAGLPKGDAGDHKPSPLPAQGYVVPGGQVTYLAPGQQPPHVSSVVVMPVVQAAPHLPKHWPAYSASVTCPACHVGVATRTEKKTGLGTWLIAIGTCLVGCFWGCCLIPFCVDGCKDTEHTCPLCNRVLGKKKLV